MSFSIWIAGISIEYEGDFKVKYFSDPVAAEEYHGSLIRKDMETYDLGYVELVDHMNDLGTEYFVREVTVDE